MTAVNLNRAVRGPVTAVPVVAGKGVRLVADTVNNRFVVEADETVLWEGSQKVIGSTNTSLTLSESAGNFEKIRVYFMGSAQNDAETSIDIVKISRADAYYTLSTIYTNNNASNMYVDACSVQIDGTSFTVARGFRKIITTSISNDNGTGPTILKIIGINRKAST